MHGSDGVDYQTQSSFQRLAGKHTNLISVQLVYLNASDLGDAFLC